MSFLDNLKSAIKDPIIPYNSLYIDITIRDILKALQTPRMMAQTQPFIPLPFDSNITCFGCRVRQIHGVNNDQITDKVNVADSIHYESCNDIHQRLQKNSWSRQCVKDETMGAIHFDLAALWARPYINNTSEVTSTSPKTLELARTNPLCGRCSLQSTRNGEAMMKRIDQQQQQQQQSTIALPLASLSFATPYNKYTPPPHSYNVLTMLSVRSALSAWLLHRNFPKGSIVIFSAINIPDMAKVIRAHDLIPLPIDIDPNTTMIDIDVLERTIQHYGVTKGLGRGADNHNNNNNNNGQNTQENDNDKDKKPKICAIIISYIFGIRNDISNVINLVHKYDIPFIEDCAEAYTDVNFVGHPDSDLTLFSFGSIKNSTAFGGGIARAKSFDDYIGMMYIQSLWPRVTNQKYFDKVKKMLPLSLALNQPLCSLTVYRIAKLIGIDIKETFVANLRGFPGEMVFGIRHQPSPALTYILRHRIATATNASLTLSAQKGLEFEGLLMKYDVDIEIVGRYAENRGYWLYPFIVSDPTQITDALGQCGVQVYRGATQLTCLQVPDELKIDQNNNNNNNNNDIDIDNDIPCEINYAKQLMAHVVYLPLSKQIPSYVMDTIAKHLQSICGMRGNNNTNQNSNNNNSDNRHILDYPPIEPGVKRKSEQQIFQSTAARL